MSILVCCRLMPAAHPKMGPRPLLVKRLPVNGHHPRDDNRCSLIDDAGCYHHAPAR